MKQQSNELDLSLFFSNIYRFFYKNSRLLLTFILLGAVLGFVYDTISKPYYESTAYATSALSYFETEEVDYKSKKIILDQQAMVDIINDISRLVDED
jgi:LPS O-antigen subunit length determinant protein (WzzB/FepE family)